MAVRQKWNELASLNPVQRKALAEKEKLEFELKKN